MSVRGLGSGSYLHDILLSSLSWLLLMWKHQLRLMLVLGALQCTLLLGFILSEHTPSSFRFCTFCLSERGISWFLYPDLESRLSFQFQLDMDTSGCSSPEKKQSAFHWQAPITEHSQGFKTHKNHWSPSWLRKLQIQFTSKLWIPGLSFPLSNFHELEMLPLSCFPCISKKTNSFLFSWNILWEAEDTFSFCTHVSGYSKKHIKD